MPTDLTGVPTPPNPNPNPNPPTRTQRVRAALSARRLLVGLLALLLVPGVLGVAAFNYETPAAAPPATVEPHEPLPQTPDSVARAQLDRSQQATRAARKLTAPQLLTPSRTEPAGSLATLALAPRATPYTLAELRTIAPSAFADVPGVAGAVLVTANIEVPTGTTLVVDSATPDVRLASSAGGFAALVSRGTLRVAGSDETSVRISSWDPATGAMDAVSTDGRAFVLQIGGRMDVDHARFSSLGFGTGTTSGVAWRGAAVDTGSTERVKAQGTVTSSVFTGNHFGAYTHEAVDMAWENNTFVGNEEYGFDPHDFSDGFLVTGNTAAHNGKHGFIFSRGCNSNVLRDNYAYANAGHGFMIDDGRSVTTAEAQSRIDTSNYNIVTGNVAYDNTASGVEIEGGIGNVVSGNTLTRNDIGVRIKDGAAASIVGNTIVDSDRYAVNVLDSGGQVPVSGNQISGSWAAVNLASATSATVGANTITDVTTPLVVDSVVTYETTWVDDVAKYIRWNPLLVLWGLILGVPLIVGMLRVLEQPFLRRRHAVHGS